MQYLVVTTPDGRSYRREIEGGSLRIGRAGSNDLPLNDATVSRIHAQLVRRREGYFLVDLGGKSGTLLNGKRVRGLTPLQPGDQIRLGTTLITFQGDPTSPVELSPAPLPAGPGTRILTPEEVRQSDLPTPSPPPGIPPSSQSDYPSPVPGGAGRLSPRAFSSMLKILSEADRELIFHRPLEQILERIMDLASEAVGYERGVLMLLENDELVMPVVRVPPGEGGATIRISRAIVDRVVGRRESVLTSDALRDERFGDRDSVIGQNVRSAMCVPLQNEEKVVGLLYVDSRRDAGLFTEDGLRLLSHLASVVAAKIEQARLFGRTVRDQALERELQQAASIQETLLPVRGPEIPGYLVTGRSLPCRGVGGDCFDYLLMPGGRHAFGLGDVAGRGLSAALLMCCFHSTLRALAGQDPDEAQTMERVNRLLCPTFPSNRFVTSFFGVLDHGKHRMTYVNAGQDPPYLVRRDGETLPLPVIGMPLGLFENSRYERGSVDFGPGDLLLCYSDGATDGTNAADEMFGSERLVSVAREAREGTPEEILSALLREIARHHGEAAYEDDITLMVLKRTA